MNKKVFRGEIYWYNFGKPDGSEQSGKRPVLITQNDVGNTYSPTTIVCVISSKIKKKELPTHVLLKDYSRYGLTDLSQVLAEQTKTVDKNKLGDYIGKIDLKTMCEVDRAIEISVNVGSAKVSYEPREIRSIRIKVEQIKTLDSFLIETLFTSKNKSEGIQEFIQERFDRIKDLEKFAKSYNLDYKEFYNPMMYGNLDRMVV